MRKNDINDLHKVTYYTYLLDEQIIESVKECFIAFDVETTGLKAWEDKIVEIGAVVFEYGIPIKKFSTLVNPKKHISENASKVSGITDKMIKKAPCEEMVYRDLVDFFGTAMCGKIFVCSHNINFDMMFLIEALNRLGYSGDIYCLDTLDLSKKIIKYVPNYKLASVANYYGLVNENEHRAMSDAEICGKVLINLIYELKQPNQIIYEQKIRMCPNNDEMKICLYIKNMIFRRGENTDLLRCKRKRNNLVEINYLYNFLEFSVSNEKTYIVVERDVAVKMKLFTEICNASEGYANSRYLISNLQDIDILEDYIFSKYEKAKHNALEYMGRSEHTYKKALWEMNLWTEI